MAKTGMERGVYFNADPTFAAVLGKFNKEAREARKKEQAMKPFRVIALIHKIATIAGFRVIGTLEIQDIHTDEIYRSKHQGVKR